MKNLKLFISFGRIPLIKGTVAFLLFLSLISALSGCINATNSNYVITNHGNQSPKNGIKINTGYFDETPYIFKAKNDGFLISDGRHINFYNLEGMLLESWDLNKYFNDFDGAEDIDIVKIDSLNVFIANNNRSLYLLYTKDKKALKMEILDNGGFNIRVQNHSFYTAIQTYNDSVGDLEKGILSYQITGMNCIYNGFINGTKGMFVDFEIINNKIIFWYDDRKVHSCSIDSIQSETFPFNVDKRTTGIQFIGLDSGIFFFKVYNDSINKDRLLLCDDRFIPEKEKIVNIDYSKIELNKDFFYYKASGLIYSCINDRIFVLLINERANMTIYRINELL